MNATALLLCALCAQTETTWLDDVVSRVQSTAETRERATMEVKKLKSKLAKMKHSKVNPKLKSTTKSDSKGRVTYGSREAKQNAIEELESQIKLAEMEGKSDSITVPTLDSKALHAGCVWGNRLKIQQVVSASAAIVKLYPPAEPEMLVYLVTDTKGWVDDTSIKFIAPILFTGTKQYQTVLGSSKTIRKARVWTIDEGAIFIAKVKERRRAESTAAAK